MQPKQIFDLILNYEKIKKLNDNFKCEFGDTTFEDGRYFKVTIGNITMESYPVGNE